MKSVIKLLDTYYKHQEDFTHEWWMGALKMVKDDNAKDVDWDEYIRKGRDENETL